MATITNDSCDGWDIPLYGVHLAPGESYVIPEETIEIAPTGQATIAVEAPPVEAPVTPEGE